MSIVGVRSLLYAIPTILSSHDRNHRTTEIMSRSETLQVLRKPRWNDEKVIVQVSCDNKLAPIGQLHNLLQFLDNRTPNAFPCLSMFARPGHVGLLRTRRGQQHFTCR